MTHKLVPWEISSEPSDTGSSKEPESGNYVCCSTNHPISPGSFVPKADGGPRVCEMEANVENKMTNGRLLYACSNNLG